MAAGRRRHQLGSGTTGWSISISRTISSRIMSAFYIRKLKTYFAATDTDKDGVLTENDYHEMVRRFVDIGQLGPTEEARIQGLATKVSYLSISSFLQNSSVHLFHYGVFTATLFLIILFLLGNL